MDERPPKSPTPARARPDVRRAPRLAVLGQIHGRVAALDVPVALKDLGPGGFALVSPVEFFPGAIHEFQFTTVDRSTVTLSAEVVHGMRFHDPSGPPQFLVGFRFLRGGSPVIDRTIRRLLDSLEAPRRAE